MKLWALGNCIMPYALCITHYVAPSPDVENFSSINLDRRTFSQGTNIFIPSCVPPYIVSTPTSTGASRRLRVARTQGHKVSREQPEDVEGRAANGPGQEVGPETRPRSLERARPPRPPISLRHITSMLVPHEVEIPQFSHNMHSENIKPAE